MERNLRSQPRLGAIIRAAGTRGYVPIETLVMGRQDYAPQRQSPPTASAKLVRTASAHTVTDQNL